MMLIRQSKQGQTSRSIILFCPLQGARISAGSCLAEKRNLDLGGWTIVRLRTLLPVVLRATGRISAVSEGCSLLQDPPCSLLLIPHSLLPRS